MPSSRTLSRRRSARVLVILAATAALTACGGPTTPEGDAPSRTARASRPSATSTPTPTLPVVAGYDVGEIPPVPLFVLPDLGMLDASLAGFAVTVDDAVGDLPGVRVEPARCDAQGIASPGALLAYGDGSGTLTGPDGTVVNYGDGSGSYTLNGTTVTVYGDGSGTYSDATTTVVSYGDGSGSYDDGTTSVTLYGDGSGTWARGERTITNYGDGSGTYADGATTITNYGDGSGLYDGPDLTIVNHGDGSGLVDGIPTDMPELPPVPRLGSFPSMGVLAPVPSCGTRVVLDAAVLFDFGSHALRPDATATLDAVAQVLATVPAARVEGHTDAVSSHELNQALSERRADAVAAALADRGMTGSLETTGFGETRPVAPNEVDGVDDPAGRQLNRRVEIVVPS
ncbi:OmpA family protein [Cellulomonas biazotea]|uniref:OmpA family protein n=1 Tax=Cellulomonas biazotea TaxID=1709 RepID=UPI001031E003|nr:OmpA family protein [Cellulomonas biazotea]